MNYWQYHDERMKELKQLYLRISKQTQIRLQAIFESIDFDFDYLYNIADKEYKSRINTYIEEWKDKGLLTGYFGILAKNIYNRTKVKNSEILELLIYGAYVEEQSKIQEKELNIMYADANYYYQEGQKEVNNTLHKKERKPIKILKWALFLALLDQPNVKGYVFEQDRQATIQFNTQQIYRQMTIDLQQQKIPDIKNDIYQNLIKRQNNSKININGDKISGNIDTQLIGVNNLAKVEGIKEIDNNAQIRFIAIIDGNETDMCHSLDGQVFYINKENKFERYYGETQKELRIEKIKCFGLVLGLNLPPISHHFHWCRSIIQYLSNKKQEENILMKRSRSPLNKKIIEYNTEDISKVILKQNLNNANKVIKDFPILNNKIKSIKIRNNKDYSMAIKPQKNGDGFDIYINKDSFKSIKIARQEYQKLVELNKTPKGTTYKDILTHELGHGIIYEIIKKKHNGNANLINNDWCNSITSTEIVNKALKNIGIISYQDKYKTLLNLSEYSLESASETIAEAFADYYSNGRKAQKISKEIIKIMKGMI